MAATSAKQQGREVHAWTSKNGVVMQNWPCHFCTHVIYINLQVFYRFGAMASAWPSRLYSNLGVISPSVKSRKLMGASTSWTFLNNPYNPLSPNNNHFSQYNLHLKLPWIWAENCWSHPPFGPRWSKHPREWCHPPGHAPIPRLHGAPRGSCTNQSRWPMASSGTARLARRSTPARENCPRQLATGEFWWDRKPVHGIIQFIRGRLRTLFLNDIKCSWPR